MFIATKIVFGWNKTLQRYVVTERHGFDYEGEVALCKKGRDSADQAIKTAQGTQKTYSGVQDASRASDTGFLTSLMPTTPGQMSPYAKAQFDSTKRNIDQTYGDASRVAEKNLAYRGMGNAPTGMLSSVLNSNARNKGAAETEAFEKGLGDTYNEGLAGANAFENRQQLYNPITANAAVSNAAATRNQMGSTLGDIGKGIATGASLFGSMTGAGFFGSALPKKKAPAASGYAYDSGAFGV